MEVANNELLVPLCNETAQNEFIDGPSKIRGPHRRCEPSCFDECVSTSNAIKFHVEKTIVRTPRPVEFNQWLEQYVSSKSPKRACDLVNSLATNRQWTSTAEFSMKESALPTPRRRAPTTTLEEIVDPMKSSLNKRYGNAPMLWQDIGRKWDLVQLRKPISQRYAFDYHADGVVERYLD